MFTPKWKKHAKLLHKGSQKFLHYKRDLLPADRIDEIESRRNDLKAAIKKSDKEATKEAGKLLEKTCEQALPRYKGNKPFQENLEVIFVAIVVALGIRTYFLQPFRIPTNSMYPTQNGITGHALPQEKWPASPIRLAQHATHGRNYFSLKTQSAVKILKITDYTAYHFFPRVRITFSDGRVETFSGSATSIYQGGLTALLDKLVKKQAPRLWLQISHETAERRSQIYASSATKGGPQQLSAILIPANTIIAEGYSQTGDLILVDKVSYHFRKPTPGEVFVFDTRGIPIPSKTEEQHYIKRLIGVPGDRLKTTSADKIKSGYTTGNLILRNGALATEPGILKVQSLEGEYNGYGSTYPEPENRMKTEFTLRNRPSTGLSEYWAMGDNSFNSSDSRVWGTVKEFNVVGPAFFTLWPFGSGHWGQIK